MPYVTRDEVKRLMPDAAAGVPNALLDFALQIEESNVSRATGLNPLPQYQVGIGAESRDMSLVGVISGLVAARVLRKVYWNQPEMVREARELHSEATRELERYDVEETVPGEPGERPVDSGAVSNLKDRGSKAGDLWPAEPPYDYRDHKDPRPVLDLYEGYQ